MPTTEGQIDVDPGAADSIDVTIKVGGGAAVTTYTARDGSSAHASPETITTRTSFHVKGAGTYEVVCSFGGVTIHDANVQVSGYGSPVVVSPVIDSSELADVVAGYRAAPFLVAGDVHIFTGSGAPVNGTTGDNVAGTGSLYVDTANGKWYSNTGAIDAPTWVLVGAQT